MTTALPLTGLKVLDFCWVAVGPMTTKYLAEYGATVLRVESAQRPETLRRAGPFAGGQSGINRSGYFANYNANKYGLSIDMGHPRAPELILRIAEWADVVTENFTPAPWNAGAWATMNCAGSTPASSCSAPQCWGAAARCRPSPASAPCCPPWPATPTSSAGRPWPRQSLRRLYRLRLPQIRRGRHPGRRGPPAAHRPGNAPGYVATGMQPALRRPDVAGRRRQRAGTAAGGQPPSVGGAPRRLPLRP